MELVAPTVRDILAVSGNITVASTGTAYSRSFVLHVNRAFGLELLFSSPGDVNVKVELEQANVAPSSEQSSDTNWIVPEKNKILSTITDELVHIVPVTPAVSVYARLKLTGLGSNNALTALARARFVGAEMQ